MANIPFQTVDEYFALCDEPYLSALRQLRAAIREAAPEATEKISWAMPTFYQHGNLIHYFARKDYIGLYPGGEAMEVFQPELTHYKLTKGSIHLPIGEPMPLALVQRITRYCVEQNAARNQARLAAKPAKRARSQKTEETAE